MNVLIVEDSDAKYEKLENCVRDYCAPAKIDRAKDAGEGFRKLVGGEYHLMLLDVRLPMAQDTEPTDEASSQLLNEMRRKIVRQKWPTIIGTTQFTESFTNGDIVFGDFLSRVVLVSDTDGRWKQQIQMAIQSITAKVQSASLTHNCVKADVAIVTALKSPEFEMVTEAFGAPASVIKVQETSEHWLNYTVKTADGREMSVVCACANEMGMCAMASLVTRLVIVSHPKVLILAGIMGGNKERVSLGDLVISEDTWDFRSGKITEQGFQADVKTRACDMRLKRCFENILTETELDRIWRGWPGDKPSTRATLKAGATACSAAVIANDSSFEEMERQKRKVVGVEMEALGCYDAAYQLGELRPEVLSIKAVCDLGDGAKNDRYQRYCAYLAAQAVLSVIKSGA
ncbi:phosphorylase family protein [Oleiharenicola lentus]|uniref:phosphorylase family protein n=1 Tax=Oleiharenicola lentus TaxID=2508720 RepID=UPI003F66CE58